MSLYLLGIMLARLALLGLAIILINASWRALRSGAFSSRLIGSQPIPRQTRPGLYWSSSLGALAIALAVLGLLYATQVLR